MLVYLALVVLIVIVIGLSCYQNAMEVKFDSKIKTLEDKIRSQEKEIRTIKSNMTN